MSNPIHSGYKKLLLYIPLVPGSPLSPKITLDSDGPGGPLSPGLPFSPEGPCLPLDPGRPGEPT